MPCPKQLNLRAGSPRCICPFVLFLNPGWVARRFLFQFQEHIVSLSKQTLNWCLCRSTAPYIPKTQTRPTNHTTSLWLCGPYPPAMFQLYTAPHQSVYSCLDSLCRQKQNTAGTSVQSCFNMEGLDGTVPGRQKLTFSYPLPSQTVRGDSAPTCTFG